MNEKDFSKKLTSTLDWGLGQLDAVPATRLAAARQRALAAYREPVSLMALATPAGFVRHFRSLSNGGRLAFLAAPLVAGLLVWGGLRLVEDPDAEIGAIDAALLTGELPVDAFLDKDFDSWVRE